MNTKVAKMKEAFLDFLNGHYDFNLIDEDIKVFLESLRSGADFHDEPLWEELELQEYAKDFTSENVVELKEAIIKYYEEE